MTEEDKVKKREYDRKYYSKNRDKLIKHRQNYYQNHIEEIKQKKESIIRKI